jgi:hypothetical protein
MAPENFYLALNFYIQIHGFLSLYLQIKQTNKKKNLAPEKKGLAPELFLVLSTPDS